MKLKDRPNSREYFLISSPRLCVDRAKGTIKGRFTKKPEIEVQTESINTHMSDVNFWFGREQSEDNLTASDDKLSLLKQPFNLFVEYKKISYSEVIEKIDTKDCDKAA